jgi:hypothetical protein
LRAVFTRHRSKKSAKIFPRPMHAGVVKWSLSADPMAWNLTGEFIFKDIVLLCVCAVLLLASLPQSVKPSRSS